MSHFVVAFRGAVPSSFGFFPGLIFASVLSYIIPRVRACPRWAATWLEPFFWIDNQATMLFPVGLEDLQDGFNHLVVL